MLRIRQAGPADAAEIVALIAELAAYEREPDAVEADAATVAAQLADPDPPFGCLLAEHGAAVLGFALYFQSYSTWRARPGLYLEDLFIRPAHRGRGAARALLVQLARLARERGYARMEWAVLDWNELAAGFYRRLGARPRRDWVLWRIDGAALERLAAAAAGGDDPGGA